MAEQNNKAPQFSVQKIYTKNISFSVNDDLSIWEKAWKPDINISVNSTHIPLPEEDTFEVTLTVEINVTSDKIKAFNLEIEQAGIFHISNIPQEHIENTLNVFCPNMLYNYAREVVSDYVIKGGFPQLCLSYINFETIYANKLKKQQETKH